ncbi:lytic murein transglycosylase [Streptomyces stramineus]
MEGRHLNADGLADQKILGPRLTGGEFAVIKDTDGGRWDDDTEYDRAVGPTQFIPSTWESFGADGNGDGIKDPNNIFDASLGTARYLCANNRDLNNPRDLDKAVLAYNPSRAYVNAVLAWMRTYQSGNVTELPDAPGGSGITPGGSAPGGTSPSPGRTPHTKPTPPAKTVPPAKPTPPSTSKPVPPAKPTPPAEPKPPHKPGGDEGSKPTPAPATRLERMGDRAIEAVTVDVFEKRASVRAWDSAGKHTAGTRVRFEIVGVEGTESHFIGRDKKPVVTTGKDGIATAPQLLAGTRAEQFVVRATIVGGTGEGASADFDATVKVGTVDKLVRVGSEKPLQTGAGTAFTDKVELKASGNGKSVSGTTVTATVTSPDGKTDVKAGPTSRARTASRSAPSIWAPPTRKATSPCRPCTPTSTPAATPSGSSPPTERPFSCNSTSPAPSRKPPSPRTSPPVRPPASSPRAPPRPDRPPTPAVPPPQAGPHPSQLARARVLRDRLSRQRRQAVPHVRHVRPQLLAALVVLPQHPLRVPRDPLLPHPRVRDQRGPLRLGVLLTVPSRLLRLRHPALRLGQGVARVLLHRRDPQLQRALALGDLTARRLPALRVLLLLLRQGGRRALAHLHQRRLRVLAPRLGLPARLGPHLVGEGLRGQRRPPRPLVRLAPDRHRPLVRGLPHRPPVRLRGLPRLAAAASARSRSPAASAWAVNSSPWARCPSDSYVCGGSCPTSCPSRASSSSISRSSTVSRAARSHAASRRRANSTRARST